MSTLQHTNSRCWKSACPHPVPEPVCKMQTPALFTMAQSSPQPQSVDTENYARVNRLPSTATSSSSSGELHLYIESDTSSPSVPVNPRCPRSSSQELLLQGDKPVPQAPPVFGATTITATPISQPPPQPTGISSCADEVIIAEQSGRSTPETVISIWAYFGMIRGSRTRSQPLVYPPPVMPTPSTQRPRAPSPRYGPTITPLRPQTSFPQPHPTIDRYRRTITRAPTLQPEDAQEPQHTKSILCAHLRSRLQNRLLDTLQAHISTPPQHTLKPTASSCSLGHLENEYVQEGWDRDLPLECLHFPINRRFTERFWHQSKYFYALADRQNDYLNTFCTRDVTPYRIYQKNDLFYLQFAFVLPTLMDVNNQTNKVNRVKMLHSIHNYLFVQHHIHRTNPLIHMNSRFQYANTKLTSPYYKNYSYIIQPNYCEGTIRNFGPIKNYLLFLSLYAKTSRPILVPIEYLKCVEGGAKKRMYSNTFNLLYRDWITDKLDNREPSAEETQVLNHLLALQPHCNVDLFPCALAAYLARDLVSLDIFQGS